MSCVAVAQTGGSMKALVVSSRVSASVREQRRKGRGRHSRGTEARRWRTSQPDKDDKVQTEDENNTSKTNDNQERKESEESVLGTSQAFRPKASPRRKAESTDAISSALSRRFGLKGGLAWVAVLAAGVIGEQIKTRLEVRREAQTTVEVQNAKSVSTPSGLEYRDIKIGGGQNPRRGDLVVLQYKAYLNGVMYEDTKSTSKKGIAFVFGSRPLPPGIPIGFEEGLSTMKSGGKRIVDVPPKLGFGNESTVVQSRLTKEAFEIPPNSDIKYEIELIRVSIPPS